MAGLDATETGNELFQPKWEFTSLYILEEWLGSPDSKFGIRAEIMGATIVLNLTLFIRWVSRFVILYVWDASLHYSNYPLSTELFKDHALCRNSFGFFTATPVLRTLRVSCSRGTTPTTAGSRSGATMTARGPWTTPHCTMNTSASVSWLLNMLFWAIRIKDA